MSRITGTLVAICLATTTFGCTHQIAFDRDATSCAYLIGAAKQSDTSIVAVVEPATLAASTSFRAWSTGIAHKWVANYGEMLVQVTDMELPQVVEFYERSPSYLESTSGRHRLTIELSVPSYVFEDYRAKLTIKADVYGPGRTAVFSRTYSSEGSSGAGKMIGLGVFGQKSAVRQSSLVAFKNVFEELRRDIATALGGGGID